MDHFRTMAIPDQLRPLVTEIEDALHPESIWLFGSRARGDYRPDSDWDLLVALPDHELGASTDPLLGWSFARRSGVPVTILMTTSSELREAWGAPNTLAYAVAKEGFRLER
jgi:predicted nucleotidyltransferase